MNFDFNLPVKKVKDSKNPFSTCYEGENIKYYIEPIFKVKLDNFDELDAILSGVDTIFLDEREKNIIGTHYDVDEMVITDGSNGSRIVGEGEIRIKAVKCDNVVDTTGCGDTFMAAYITQKLLLKSSENAGNFASRIASEKIKNFGPYNSNG